MGFNSRTPVNVDIYLAERVKLPLQLAFSNVYRIFTLSLSLSLSLVYVNFLFIHKFTYCGVVAVCLPNLHL